MSKFRLFLFTGISFGADWAINVLTGTNLDDPNLYFNPVFDAINSTAGNSSFYTYLISYWQTQLPYLLLLIKISPFIPLFVIIITRDKKRNAISYLAGLIIGFFITYSLLCMSF